MEEKTSTFKGKNILVVGLARSGVGAANLLSVLGAKVTVTDKKSRETLEGHIDKLHKSVQVITDENPRDVFESSDMIVVSPGVPLDIPPLQYAKSRGIEIIGELELAYQIVTEGVRDQGSGSDAATSPDFIGITGTNGKSTVTTMIDLILKGSGYRTLLGGNIGNALTEEILKAAVRSENTVAGSQKSAVRKDRHSEELVRSLSYDFIVAEISSFQLESIREFRPNIAAILNVSPDHLDRYKSMTEYVHAKARIFENQRHGDYLIVNADDPLTMKMSEEHALPGKKSFPHVLFFSRRKKVKGVYYRDGSLYCNVPNLPFPSSDFPFISTKEIRISGAHNLENAMAASLVALLSGNSYQAVRDVLKRFSGLAHRLEFVREVNGVAYVNDSKATNIGAVEKSLEGLEKVVLIMGGMDKGSNFSALKDLVKTKVRSLVLMGEAKDTIQQALGNVATIYRAGDLREAVSISAREARPGDVVLLSPGCASFDMFTDFEDRGRKFKEAVGEVHDS